MRVEDIGKVGLRIQDVQLGRFDAVNGRCERVLRPVSAPAKSQFFPSLSNWRRAALGRDLVYCYTRG